MKIVNELKKEIAKKFTENGDVSYNSTGNNMIDLLFMAEFFQANPNQVKIGQSEKEKLFAMYMRDPRFGKGYRDLGRILMEQAGNTPTQIITAGRYDDLFNILTEDNLEYLFIEVSKGNPLAKKWMPRLTSKNKKIAKTFCRALKMSEKEYRAFIKEESTVEFKLSYAELSNASKETKTELNRLFDSEKEGKYIHPLVDSIDFEKVPSLAMTKYYGAFAKREDTKERFSEYLEAVKNNKAKLNTSTTTVRDAKKLVSTSSTDVEQSADIIGKKIVEDSTQGLSINAICVLDTSGSMDWGDRRGLGTPYDNAVAVAHGIATNSTYAKNQVISFSSKPQLIEIKGDTLKEQYKSMHTGDCSNTDLGKVFKILMDLNEFPEYVIVLSDMELDKGSSHNYREWFNLVKENGANTKLIWWNFNQRNKTVPEYDEYGNIYMSGYDLTSLMLLPGVMDMEEYLDKILNDYKSKINI